MEDREGQHMGVVEKALEKCMPPFSMMSRVLFMACMEPGGSREGGGVRWNGIERATEDIKR